MLDKAQPDFFLLDINMPGMNGLELAEQLRQRQIRVPIVMLSADMQEQYHPPGESYIYDDYLIKPISNQQLLDKIALHLKLEWTYQDDSQAPSPTPLSQSPTPQNRPDEALQIPDHSLILELKACAEMGYHKGALDILSQLTEQSVLCPDTLSYLEQLCRNFQFEQLAQCLEPNQP